MSISGFDNDHTFPEDISSGSNGGAEFCTEIVGLDNGREQRNQRWAQARWRYDVAYGVKTWAQLRTLVGFHLQQRGRARGYRFRDPLDHTVASGVGAPLQTLLTGLGPGVFKFQFTQYYGVGTNRYARSLTKPRTGTMWVRVGASVLTEGVDYTVDYETGIVTLAADPSVSLIYAAGQFDVPVRFDVDYLSINLADYLSGSAVVPIVGLPV